MSDALVSIIIPAYNAQKYITDSIRSVLAQTYPNWELIVVDDGSTDQTATIVNEFVRQDSRIRYIFQENGRLGKARNTGLMNAGGSLIAFLDSDDLWISTKLEKQTRAMAENNADVVFSKAYVFRDENINDETEILTSSVGKFSGPEFFDALIRQPQIPVLTVLLKKSALDRVGLFEEGKAYHGCEDYDLWLRLARAGVIFYGMSDVLARYRRREVIGALIDEGKISEAKQFVHELYLWNKNSIVTRLQKILISIWPQQFNFISRECLYRTEWHLQNNFGRGKTH